jgi:hypothetical protein
MISHVTTQALGQNPTSKIQIVQCEQCNKTSSAEMIGEGALEKAIAVDPWLRTYRTIQTGDGRVFGYCSDLCEIEAIKTGAHNMPEAKPKVETNVSPAAIAAAAAAQAQAKKADKALRDGGNIQIAD